MNVLLISRHAPPQVGGTERFIDEFFELPRTYAEFTVDAVLLRTGKEGLRPRAGVTFHLVDSPLLNRLLWHFREGRSAVANALLLLWTASALAARALRVAFRRRPDAIYAVGGLVSASAGLLVGALTRVPVVMHYHYGFRFSESSPLMRRAYRAFHRGAAAVIGNCPSFADDIVRLGVPPRRAQYVFNWVDTELFRFQPERAPFRERWLPHRAEETVLLFVGRLDASKHVDRIAAALRGQDLSGVTVLFAGDGELREELERVNAGGRIVLVGARTPAELSELHQAADALLWGSMDIDYPSLVVMEAMCSGLPVVTSSESLNRFREGEPIDGGTIGAPRLSRLFPPTTDGIRAAVRYAVDHRDALRDLRPEVARFGRARFGPANAEKLVEILRRAAGVRAG